jgi:DNA mismatch endonuclease (patch repair protein)
MVSPRADGCVQLLAHYMYSPPPTFQPVSRRKIAALARLCRVAKQASQDGAKRSAGKTARKTGGAAAGAAKAPAVSKSAVQAAAKGKAYPFVTDPGRAANMRSNRRTDTKPEIALRSALHAMGYRYRKDFRLDLPLRRVRPDIAFTGRKVAVFVDGCFWHACPEHGSQPKSNEWYWSPKLVKNVERDRAADEALRQAGWTVVRLWEHVPLPDAVALVVSAVGEPRRAPR